MLQERLDLAGKREHAAIPKVIQGFLAQTVPGAEGCDAFGGVLLVRVNNGLAIGSVAVAMARGFERGTQRGMVENLAVEDQPQVAVLVRHRLMAARDVYNGEAAEPEIAPWIAIISEVIWAPMTNGIGHALDGGDRFLGRLSGDVTCDSAHAKRQDVKPVPHCNMSGRAAELCSNVRCAATPASASRVPAALCRRVGIQDLHSQVLLLAGGVHRLDGEGERDHGRAHSHLSAVRRSFRTGRALRVGSAGGALPRSR